MVHTKLYFSHIVVQIALGTISPLTLLALTQMVRLSDRARQRLHAAAGSLSLIGIFAMRWNVVIGASCSPRVFSATQRTR